MNFKKTALMAAVGLAIAFGSATAASANTNWEQNHPRRTEVMGRVHEQNLRITKERREGELTRHQAMAMRGHDRMVLRQEQRDAHFHGGAITKGEQHHLNKELNRNSRRIGG